LRKSNFFRIKASKPFNGPDSFGTKRLREGDMSPCQGRANNFSGSESGMARSAVRSEKEQEAGYEK
jgi:hypothetical protein